MHIRQNLNGTMRRWDNGTNKTKHLRTLPPAPSRAMLAPRSLPL